MGQERVPTLHGYAQIDTAGVPAPCRPGPPPWLVFDQDGRLIGRLAVPTGLRILEWGDDYLLGAQPNADGVEHDVLYRLIREP